MTFVRLVVGAVLGCLFFGLVALDLVVLGIVRFENIGVTALPVAGLLIGALLGRAAARRS